MDLGMPWWVALIRLASFSMGLLLIFVMVPAVQHDWKFLETWKKYRECAVVLFAAYCISATIEGVKRDINPGVSSGLRIAILVLLCLGVAAERMTRKNPR